ncbi:MAG: hypothetical protein LBQ77_00095 [Treponema sp.]|jgi:KaiC/GvpD/RAD55 family RecA-like ATPase|nr:hypothetical protein [Treponema sp.]
MVTEELIARSPVRIFEQSINGGLNKGEIGIVTAPSGIGKTSVLVQIALDKLLQDRNVIHISFTQHTDYVLAWYENIFKETLTNVNVDNDIEIKNKLIKNRVLMHFNQEKLSVEQILRSIRALISEGGFGAEQLIVDGFDFSRANRDIIKIVQQFAKESGLSVWFSCTVQETDYDSRHIPYTVSNYEDLIAVVIVLTSKSDYIELSVEKNRENYASIPLKLRLDSQTLLIQKEAQLQL